MIGNLPLDIQRKIQHYVYELNVSKKKKEFFHVHHEMLHGWWYYTKPDNTYLVYSYYSNNPIVIRRLSLEEMYAIYDSDNVKWKPILIYTPLFDYDMEYCFADRMPRLLTFDGETI